MAQCLPEPRMIPSPQSAQVYTLDDLCIDSPVISIDDARHLPRLPQQRLRQLRNHPMSIDLVPRLGCRECQLICRYPHYAPMLLVQAEDVCVHGADKVVQTGEDGEGDP